MFDPTIPHYRIDEDDYFKLHQAKHLAGLLANLTLLANREDNEVIINIESFSVVMHLLQEKLDVTFN